MGKPQAPLAPKTEKALETPLLLLKPQEVSDFECLGLATAFSLLTMVGTTRQLRLISSLEDR